MYQQAVQELNKFKNPDKAKIYQGFFKTGKNEYGAGDIFLGLNSEQVKNIAKKHFTKIDFEEIKKLLDSKIHEQRMCAVRMLVYKTQKTVNINDYEILRPVSSGLRMTLPWRDQDDIKKITEKVFNFYLKNAKQINNWDLVDVSAPQIVGEYLWHQPKIIQDKILYKLAKSKNLWERRIAIIATLAFIRQNDFGLTLKICQVLLNDKHDLIHKACGWMLREVGKRDKKVLIGFLNKYKNNMARVELRYAIEKFTTKERKNFLTL